MKTKNAIKKLEKLGKVIENNNKCQIDFLNHIVSFHNQDDEIICIHVRRKDDENDLMSDYHAGSYWPTLKSAIDFLTEQKEREDKKNI